MPELLHYGFMQRALAAGVLTALICSYYGVFVVQRRLAFLGSGLAHAVFGGVALGLLLGQQPLLVAVPFTVLVALGITWVRERTGLAGDTVIGVFFALAMALGVLFLSRLPTYTTDAFTYLFGSILAVAPADLYVAGAVGLLSLATIPLWGRWAYASFDREAALSDRLPVKRQDQLLIVLVAVSVVVAAKIVGIVLLSAFLVIPAAAARMVSRSFAQMTVLALACGALTTIAGLVGSYYWDTPSGATIILLQCAVFAGLAAVGVFAARRGQA